jgi:tripartite-type tricarboxylate transporter receptor subunit TctC
MTAFRTISRAVAIAGLVGVASQPALAQTYPTRSINVIVAFAAGGIADGIGRLVGQKIGERLKQKVVVDNRGGAGGNLAARAVAGAAPDGYTLLATTTALAVNETASKNRGYNTSDLRPVAIVAISPDVLAVHPSNPAKTLKEFLANGKKKEFSYGSAGVGTAPHIGAEYLFKEIAKVKYVHVPFKGGAPAVTAALGNHVDALVLTLPTVTPHINGGRLRGLGLASEKRVQAVKQVPTYREAGIDLLSGSWVGFFAPAKTPDAIVRRLNAEISQIMKEHEVLATLAKIGFEPVTKTLPETEAYFKSEIANWGKMVRAAGVSN